MTRYRKKPVEVEAWQVGSDEPMPEWIDDVWESISNPNSVQLDLAGDFSCEVFKGFYIVKDGFHYSSCSPAFFEQTYEAVNDAED